MEPARLSDWLRFIAGKIIAYVLSGIPHADRCYDVLIGNGGLLDSQLARDPQPNVIFSWLGHYEPMFSNNQVDIRADANKESGQGLLSDYISLSCC